MAFLVLALSCLPCADKGMPSTTEKTEYSLSKHISSSNSDQDDNCSPFCQCACCPGFSINHPFTVSDLVIEHESSEFSSYASFNLFTIALPVWQPPQLV